jgi:hypothetical protein
MDYEQDEQPESDSYFTRPLNTMKPFHLAAMVSRIMSELDRQDTERKDAARQAKEARALIRGGKRKAAVEPRSPTGRKLRKDRGLPKSRNVEVVAVSAED